MYESLLVNSGSLILKVYFAANKEQYFLNKNWTKGGEIGIGRHICLAKILIQQRIFASLNVHWTHGQFEDYSQVQVYSNYLKDTRLYPTFDSWHDTSDLNYKISPFKICISCAIRGQIRTD